MNDKINKRSIKRNYKNYSFLRLVRKRSDYNDNVESFINNTTLEDLICLKLELLSRTSGFKIYGLPIYKNLNLIVKEAVLKFAISISDTKKQASSFLGLAVSNFSEYLKDFKILEQFEEDYEKTKTDQQEKINNTYSGTR